MITKAVLINVIAGGLEEALANFNGLNINFVITYFFGSTGELL